MISEAARAMFAMLLAAALGGCCVSTTPPVVESPPLPHYVGWERLVEATWRGELDVAKVEARDLTGGPELDAEGDGTGAMRVGAALGFMQVAEDVDEAAFALARAASGCGICHMETGIGSTTPPPDWTHETGVDHLVHGLVWTTPMGPPPGGEPPLDALSEAFSLPLPPDTGVGADERVDRTTRVVVACAECHRELGRPVASP